MIKARLKTLAAGSALLVAAALPASAAELGLASSPRSNDVILVSGGCGIGFHRDFRGFCRPNFRRYGYGYAYRPRYYYQNRSWERHWGF